MADAESNPFATRCVRPGALAYQFPPGTTAAGLVEALRQQGWWGEIVGPHGSGKSTLLETLAPLLEAAGRRLLRHTLRQGERRVPALLLDPAALGEDALLIIDGYEQLGWLSRRRVQQICRRHRSGLLVTAHASVGLPLLLQTCATPELVQQVVALLTADAPGVVGPEDVAQCCAVHGENVRETLFALYDLYEERRR